MNTFPSVSDLNSKLEVDVQIAVNQGVQSSENTLPSNEQLTTWSQKAYLACRSDAAEVSLRIVDLEEMQSLNATYRGKDKATNVLSFTVDLDVDIVEQMNLVPLGDIVICDSVVRKEAVEQNKTLHDHYAHMVCHAVLHLCGYDHQTDKEAHKMESLEKEILKKQGVDSPY